MAERSYVMLDDLKQYDDVKLAEVIGALETESSEALAELREELQQRTLAAIERAAKAGVVLHSKPPAAASDAPNKRGRKSKEELARIEAAKAAKEAAEEAEELEASGTMQAVGRA